MKKLLLLPVLLASGAVYAQTNVLKLDIFQPIVNTLALSYEHKLNESSSFQLGIAGTFSYKEGGGFSGSESDETSGFALTPEYRLYLSEKNPAMEGFYVGPYLRYQYLSQTGTRQVFFDPRTGQSTTIKTDASLNAFGGGVVVGRHWIFKKRFSLDLYGGPGYTATSVSSNQAGYKASKSDFLGYFDENNYQIRGGVTFGIAF